MGTNLPDGMEEELVMELLDNESPFFVLPEEVIEYSQMSVSNKAGLNRFVQNVYSGPTIRDIENALSVTTGITVQPQELSQARLVICISSFTSFFLDQLVNFYQVFYRKLDVSASYDMYLVFKHRLSILERGLSKVEHKYTLKIKSCDNGMADDGYKWRKYGQKSIKNSPNPR